MNAILIIRIKELQGSLSFFSSFLIIRNMIYFAKFIDYFIVTILIIVKYFISLNFKLSMNYFFFKF